MKRIITRNKKRKKLGNNEKRERNKVKEGKRRKERRK